MPPSERRTRLLDEAVRLLSAGGLGAVSHRSVESAAGVPHGSVTYWFGSREGLISALIDWLCAKSEAQVGAIAAFAQEQLAAGQTLDTDAVARALTEWMDNGAALHLARMELELQGAREPAHAARMTQAAQTFWDMGARVAAALGSDHPARDGRALAIMLDGVLLDRLAHPPQDQEVVDASVRWLLSSLPGAPTGATPPG